MTGLPVRSMLALLLLAVSVMTCAGSDSQDPAGERRALSKALDRGDVAAVEQTLAGRPDDGVSVYFRAEVAAMRGRLSVADSLFARAAALASPMRGRALARRAEVMLGRGLVREALAEADRTATLLEARADNPADDWMALGIAYEVLGSARAGQGEGCVGRV